MWKYTAADKRLLLLHSMWAFMYFIVNYVWWKGRYIVTSPYGCRKWNCCVDVTFIAITGFAQPTSLQRWPPFGLIHLLKRVRIHVNVSLNGFQRPLRIYLSPQRSYCRYDSCTKNDITNFIFMRNEGLWSNSLALLHWSTDRIRLYEKFIMLNFNRTDNPKNFLSFTLKFCLFLTESHHMTSKYLVISYIIINNIQTSFICHFFVVLEPHPTFSTHFYDQKERHVGLEKHEDE